MASGRSLARAKRRASSYNIEHGAANAGLQITQQTAGNGVVTNRAYDANTGLLQTIQAGAGNAIANLSFTFNAIGTLTNRGDATQSLSETFTYDTMNRLTNYDIAGGSAKTVGYDALGNIASKSDVGTYSYPTSGSPRPHAIGSITGTINTIFTYDANGNMIAGNGRTVTYTAFNMAETITQGSSVVSFVYDASHARIKQTAPDGTTVYVAGGVERFAATSGLVQWNEYLMAGSQLVGVHFTRSDSTQNTRHFVTDHLGSVAIITDEMGAVVERLAYDAWGKRRYANGSDDPTGSITSQTTKGFTGHEHIAAVGLINMNARIYDPTLGRFMTPDSVVQDFYLSQILNRYSYVGNNPLSFTDPTGHLFGIDDFIIIVVAAIILSPIIRAIPIAGSLFVIAASFLCGPAQPACAATASAAVTGVQGGDAGDIIKSFVLSYAQASMLSAAGGAIGEGTAAADVAKRFVVHGAIGGAFNALRGGDFGSGFLSAGIASLGHGIDLENDALGAAFHAVLGGVGSVAGGGKFADGAVTGAFGYLFNKMGSYNRYRLRAEPGPERLCPELFCLDANWVIDERSQEGGFVVQSVAMKMQWTDMAGVAHEESWYYYEAWEIEAGSKAASELGPGGSNDTVGFGLDWSKPLPTSVSVTWSLSARFYEGLFLDAGLFQPGNADRFAGRLLATTPQDRLYNIPLPRTPSPTASEAVYRNPSYSWPPK